MTFEVHHAETGKPFTLVARAVESVTTTRDSKVPLHPAEEESAAPKITLIRTISDTCYPVSESYEDVCSRLLSMLRESKGV